MPKLTGKQLSELYPKAKTFDQLHAENERIQQMRRPRFVAVKVGAWTTFGIVTILVVYHFIYTLLSNPGESLQVLTSVCLCGIAAAVGLAILIYLRSLIEETAGKIIAEMPLLYTAIISIMLCTGAAIAILTYNGSPILLLGGLLTLHFLLTSAVVAAILRRQ